MLGLAFGDVAAADPYQDAATANLHGDSLLARRLFREAAEAGDPRAEYQVGLMEIGGPGGPLDYSDAASWFRKAAEQGLPGAQFNLGLLFDEGRGLARDDAAAFKWYSRAADRGYGSAQIRLAAMYSVGRGAPRDPDQARAWYHKAAEQGEVDGEYHLAMMYLEDARSPPVRIVTQASFRQLMNAVFGEGSWRETGGYRTPEREDQLRAEGAWTVPEGATSRHSLGTPGAPGAFDIVVDKMSPSQAAERLRLSGAAFRKVLPEAEHGTQGAHLHLEPYLATNHSTQPSDASGDSISLIDLVLNGTGPSEPSYASKRAASYETAVQWLQKAAEQDSKDAQLELGKLYASGEGVARNLSVADAWLSLAASGRSPADIDLRKRAAAARDKIAERMTLSQTNDASNLADRLRPTTW